MKISFSGLHSFSEPKNEANLLKMFNNTNMNKSKALKAAKDAFAYIDTLAEDEAVFLETQDIEKSDFDGRLYAKEMNIKITNREGDTIADSNVEYYTNKGYPCEPKLVDDFKLLKANAAKYYYQKYSKEESLDEGIEKLIRTYI